jgi:hypothetical protein
LRSGQAKKDFEKWLKKSYNGYSVDFYLSLPKAFKYGVIVDWFDSVGIYVSIERYYSRSTLLDVNRCNYESDSENGGEYKTRPQARQKAIEKATEIYNNRL